MSSIDDIVRALEDEEGCDSECLPLSFDPVDRSMDEELGVNFLTQPRPDTPEEELPLVDDDSDCGFGDEPFPDQNGITADDVVCDSSKLPCSDEGEDEEMIEPGGDDELMGLFIKKREFKDIVCGDNFVSQRLEPFIKRFKPTLSGNELCTDVPFQEDADAVCMDVPFQEDVDESEINFEQGDDLPPLMDHYSGGIYEGICTPFGSTQPLPCQESDKPEQPPVPVPEQSACVQQAFDIIPDEVPSSCDEVAPCLVMSQGVQTDIPLEHSACDTNTNDVSQSVPTDVPLNNSVCDSDMGNASDVNVSCEQETDFFDNINLPVELPEDECMLKCRKFQEYMRLKGCGGMVHCFKRPVPKDPCDKPTTKCYAVARCG
jgi:hypothetical protein